MDLENLSIEKLYELKKIQSENNNIFHLTFITRKIFISSSLQRSISIFPEMCYYYGRNKFIDKFKQIIDENVFIIMSMPESTKEFGNTLFNIGLRFPHLNSDDITFLNNNLTNNQNYPTLYEISYDLDVLEDFKMPVCNTTPIKETLSLNDKLLFDIYDCFIQNNSSVYDNSNLKVLNILNNKIILKDVDNLKFEEFIIDQPIRTNELYQLLNENFGNVYGEMFMNKLANEYDFDLNSIKNHDFYLVDAEEILQIAKTFFDNHNSIEIFKKEISFFWYKRISTEYNDLINNQ